MYLLNQDGTSPDLARHRRGLVIGAQDADGLTHIHGWVDAEFAAYLGAIRDVWARPGINNPDDPQPQHNPVPNPLDDTLVEPEREPETDVEPEPAEEPSFPRDFGELADLAEPPVKWDLEPVKGDIRTDAQRTHDAIKAVLRDTLMSKRLGQHNGLPASVVVSTTLAELEAAAGIAVTGSGTLMPMRDLIRLAEHAYHYLIVYREHTAEPLYMGRTKRLATKAQRSTTETVAAPDPAAPKPPAAAKPTTPNPAGRTADSPTPPPSDWAADPTTGSPNSAGPPASTPPPAASTGTHPHSWTPAKTPSTTTSTPKNCSTHNQVTKPMTKTARERHDDPIL
ncbi:MAG: DUF222 domain-containing protein [Mycobacterium sp.]